MSIPFSDVVGNTGILQQTRKLIRLDASQWPTVNVANSANNWHDFVVSYGIGNDKHTQFDDTNHLKLPEGTAPLTVGVSDYAFTVDEQGNAIVTLIGVSILSNGIYVPLQEVDRKDPDVDVSTFGAVTGTPTCYDKIADNIIRLDYLPPATVAAGFKYFFQRVGSYFDASSTTKSPGVSPLLHRGYVIAAAYDAALTLGLDNLVALATERAKEEAKVIQYFADRNRDTQGRMVGGKQNNK